MLQSLHDYNSLQVRCINVWQPVRDGLRHWAYLEPEFKRRQSRKYVPDFQAHIECEKRFSLGSEIGHEAWTRRLISCLADSVLGTLKQNDCHPVCSCIIGECGE